MVPDTSFSQKYPTDRYQKEGSYAEPHKNP